MEILKTLAARKYKFLSCHRYFVFTGHKDYEESLVLTLTNDGGYITFTFTDSNGQETIFDNPISGEYVIPLKKGEKTKLVITASKAIGAYNIKKKTIKI